MTDPDWRHLPPLTTLRAFEATARLGGYSAAARSLNVTPAAIAQQVRKLETDVGAPLVRREGRGLALTGAGQRLAAPLREAFMLISSSVGDLRQREAARGVRVSTTDYFVDAVILPGLFEFWGAHPGVELSFSPEGSKTPVDVDAFDVFVRGAVSGDERIWDHLSAEMLIDTPLILCGAPKLVGDGRIDPAELPWISEGGMPPNVFARAAREAGCDLDAIRIVDPGHAKLELEAAVMGYGLTLTSELIVRRHLADGSLVRIDGAVEIPGAYWLITRKGPRREAVRHFIDWLKALCAPLSYRAGPN